MAEWHEWPNGILVSINYNEGIFLDKVTCKWDALTARMLPKQKRNSKKHYWAWSWANMATRILQPRHSGFPCPLWMVMPIVSWLIKKPMNQISSLQQVKKLHWWSRSPKRLLLCTLFITHYCETWQLKSRKNILQLSMINWKHWSFILLQEKSGLNSFCIIIPN